MSLPGITCHLALQNAHRGVDVIESRIQNAPNKNAPDYPIYVASHFKHFATHNCCFGLSVLCYLLYVFQATTCPHVMVAVVSMILYIEPSISTSEVTRKLMLFTTRKKKSEAVVDEFRKYMTDEILKYISGVKVVPCTPRKPPSSTFTRVDDTTTNTNIHTMD